MIEKVLLLFPPAKSTKDPRDVNPLPPLGIGYIASVLEDNGQKVKIVDALMDGWEQEVEVANDLIRIGLSYKEISAIIEEFKPDVVGVSCLFSRQYDIYHDMFKLIKDVNKDITVIAGGPHVTVMPEEVFADENCDFVFMGEAELAMKEFINKYNNEESFKDIDGFGWKENGSLKINRKENFVKNLDELPFPAYHLINIEKYFGLTSSHGTRHKKRFSAIMTSRGCPAKCTFCSAKQVWGKIYRYRSVDNVIEEMKMLKEKYGIEELMFEDDNVTANPKRAKEIFRRMIDEKLNFIWDTPNGVGIWSVDKEMIDLMVESGCVNLNFPVESGSQRVLKEVIRKPLDLEKAAELMKYCRKINLHYNMFLVMGMPGETLDEMWESIKYSAKNKVYIPHISIATPYPGTELFDKCLEKNYFSKPFELDHLFIRSYLIETEDWTAEDIQKMLIKSQIYLALKALLVPRYFFNFIYNNLIKNPGKSFGRWFGYVKSLAKK